MGLGYKIERQGVKHQIEAGSTAKNFQVKVELVIAALNEGEKPEIAVDGSQPKPIKLGVSTILV